MRERSVPAVFSLTIMQLQCLLELTGLGCEAMRFLR